MKDTHKHKFSRRRALECKFVSKSKKNPGYLIDQTVYSVENRIAKETDLSYFTEFGENVGQSYDQDKVKNE